MLFAAAGLLVAAGIGTLVVARPWSGGSGDGPLVTVDADRTGHPTLPGHRFAFGATAVVNVSDEPIVLRSARFADAVPELQAEETYVLGPGRRVGAFVSDDPFPLEARKAGVPLEPLAGYELAGAGSSLDEHTPSAEILLVLHAPRPGTYLANYVEVTYTQGSRTYRELLPRSFVLCVVKTQAELEEVDCGSAAPPLPPIPEGSVLGD